MRISKILLIPLLMLACQTGPVSVAGETELKTLHGTMILMLSQDKGVVSEIWAKGNNLRSELRVGDLKVITIQRGPTMYTFREGDRTGTKQTLQRGLGSLGFIKQIETVKAHGKKTGSEEIEGVVYDIYEYDVNAPSEMSILYLSRETSLPRFGISVVKTGKKTAEAIRMAYRDMEANVDIPDELFELPEGVRFTDSSAHGESLEKELAKDTQQLPDAGEAATDSKYVVVVSATAKVMDEKSVVDTKTVDDVLQVSRKQGQWWLVEDPVLKGWVEDQDVVAMEDANDFFIDAVEKDPEDANALLGKAKFTLWIARFLSTQPDVEQEESDALLDVALVDFGQSALLQPSVDAYVGRGLVREMKGELPMAIADFGRAIELEPDNTEALRHRAWSWIHADEVDNAIEDCDRMLSIEEKDAEALSLRCYALGIKGELDEAMMSCDAAIEADPELASAYMRRGLIWAGKGDDLKAKMDYDEAVRLGNDAARAIRTRILYDQGKYQQVLDDLDVVIELQPKNPEFYFKRGSVLMELDKVDSAIEDLSKAIELSPNADAYTNRGVAWMRKWDLPKAIEDFTNAIELAPEKPMNYQQRAGCYFAMQQYKEAIADYTEYLRLSPNDLVAHVQRGLCELYSGDFENAIKDFSFTIDRVPADPELFLFRGSAFNGIKEFEQAIADFTRTIELDPKAAGAYTFRGVSWNSLREMEKAHADFDEAVRVNPELEVAYVNRGSFMKSLEKYGEALEDFRTAIRLNPNRAASLNEIASILAGAPDPQFRDGREAVQFATLACSLTDYKNHEYLGTLAAAYAESGDYETAIEWQTKSVETAPEDAKMEARERLKKYQQGEPYRITPNRHPRDIASEVLPQETQESTRKADPSAR